MRLLAVVGLVLLLAVPTRADAQPASPEGALPSVVLPPALDRVLRDYERAWQARDANALAELFTEDGFVLSNGRAPVKGRAAIRAAYADGGGPLALRALAHEAQGSVGYIIGAYGPGGGTTDTGKFVLALRKGGDGRWLIAADIDNSNQRPRGPQAPATPTPPSLSTPGPPLPGVTPSAKPGGILRPD